MPNYIDFILGGGLLSAIVAIVSLRSTARKARAEAEKAEAEAETIRLDNSEQATRILLDNLMKPLIETLHETKTELDLTKRELARNTREMARFRKALERVGDCDYRDQCPVLDELRKQPKNPPTAGSGQPAVKAKRAGSQHSTDSHNCPDCTDGHRDNDCQHRQHQDTTCRGDIPQQEPARKRDSQTGH